VVVKVVRELLDPPEGTLFRLHEVLSFHGAEHGLEVPAPELRAQRAASLEGVKGRNDERIAFFPFPFTVELERLRQASFPVVKRGACWRFWPGDLLEGSGTGEGRIERLQRRLPRAAKAEEKGGGRGCLEQESPQEERLRSEWKGSPPGSMAR